jgi:hypothetical protein
MAIVAGITPYNYNAPIGQMRAFKAQVNAVMGAAKMSSLE